MFAGCRDPIQKITGDAYQKCYSMGISGFPAEQMIVIEHWTEADTEKVKQLLDKGFCSTAIAMLMNVSLERVKKKVDYIRRRKREGCGKSDRYWSEKNTNRLRQLLDQGTKVIDISKIMNLDYHRVYSRVEYIRQCNKPQQVGTLGAEKGSTC